MGKGNVLPCSDERRQMPSWSKAVYSLWLPNLTKDCKQDCSVLEWFIVTHLFVKIPWPGDSEGVCSVFLSQAVTCYYQSNHSKVEAILLCTLPKDTTSKGTTYSCKNIGYFWIFLHFSNLKCDLAYLWFYKLIIT